MTPKDTLQLAYSVLTENQKKRFETEDELDFSFGIQNLARFRGNCFKQRGCVSMVIRQIPFNVRTFDELGPAAGRGQAGRAAARPGPGDRARPARARRTTLAAMIDKINKERKGHIITVEDPIEFIHRHQSCIVNQREVGHRHQELRQPRSSTRCARTPTSSWSAKCATSRRSRPALTIAETGHLALATLHTNSAAESINRIIDVFPSTPAVAGARPARLRARGRRDPDAAAARPRGGAG